MEAFRREPSFGESTSVEDLDRVDRDSILENLKSAINGFLWLHLPQATPLGKADEIARRWYDEIRALWVDPREM